ncbi:OmpA family protein [Pontibacter pudoricolor]|uniref:OmpA family protein n=1 Tax=Pontibacter pudoricolor TaxID=2694930 RepID=UPI001390CF71|nr:OmpA family protein [Pontibacter pudoricolor]
MMKKLLLAILLLLATNSVLGQNLVRNPSLEDFRGSVDGWKIVAGTPDITSQDNRIPAKSPFANPILNPEGSPQKLLNIAFGEVCLCQWFNSNWSEVTQVELVEPLRRRKNYQISLYVIKSTAVEEAISEVSVALTRTEFKQSEPPFAYQTPYVSLKSIAYPLISSRDEWVRVTGTYTARGGERYLTISNFAVANKTELASLTGYTKGVYYCYDNVRIIPLEEAETEPSFIPTPSVTPDLATESFEGTFSIEETGFAFNSHELQAGAFPMLDKLIDFLKEHPASAILITGYTDDVGNENRNQRLSEKRAMAVMAYIVGKGIALDRITAKGMGELNPKTSNRTEAGRAKNRRVEINILTN